MRRLHLLGVPPPHWALGQHVVTLMRRSPRGGALFRPPPPAAHCRRPPPPSPAGLSSLTWLLPERFSEGELSIEALHTALGLLASFHDSIVSSAPGAPPPPGADLALALSTLEQVQVGAALRRWGHGKPCRCGGLTGESFGPALHVIHQQGLASACMHSLNAPMLLPPQVLLELAATRQEERGGASRYTSLGVFESIK